MQNSFNKCNCAPQSWFSSSSMQYFYIKHKQTKECQVFNLTIVPKQQQHAVQEIKRNLKTIENWSNEWPGLLEWPPEPAVWSDKAEANLRPTYTTPIAPTKEDNYKNNNNNNKNPKDGWIGSIKEKYRSVLKLVKIEEGTLQIMLGILYTSKHKVQLTISENLHKLLHV